MLNGADFRMGWREPGRTTKTTARPNVNNRDEYRHPDVPRGLRHEYREGFQRGYENGVRHMMGGDEYRR